MNFSAMSNIVVGVYDGDNYNITSACIKHAFELAMKAECNELIRFYPTNFCTVLLFAVSNIRIITFYF